MSRRQDQACSLVTSHQATTATISGMIVDVLRQLFKMCHQNVSDHQVSTAQPTRVQFALTVSQGCTGFVAVSVACLLPVAISVLSARDKGVVHH